MRKIYRSALLPLATVLSCGLLMQTAGAQTESSPVKVPANGEVNFRNLTLMGEDIQAALRKRTGLNQPMREYVGNTFTCTASDLWECHIWFEADGSGALFHARKLANGSLELGSAAFTYRVIGKAGDYHLCVRLAGEATEHCAKRKWDEAHYLYDEWFDNHDQPAVQGAAAHSSVHEQFAIIPGHR